MIDALTITVVNGEFSINGSFGELLQVT